MKSLSLAVVAAVIVVQCVGAAGSRNMSVSERLLRLDAKKVGGVVVKPGSQQGSIAFVNAQSRVQDADVKKVADQIVKMTRLPIMVVKNASKMTGEEAKTKFRANVAIVLIDDGDAPIALIAPEEHWAVVNVGKLAKGRDDKELTGEFLASRCRKELIRTFTHLCAGCSTQFEGNVLGVSKIEDLDTVQEFIPLDMKYKYLNFMKGIGVTPATIASYEHACKEGWAPAPTNDIQKTVWDKVHALPSDPIKIKFDPKRDK